MKYFLEILNVTKDRGIEEGEYYEMHELGLEETWEVIKGLQNNKTPGEDKLTAEV